MLLLTPSICTKFLEHYSSLFLDSVIPFRIQVQSCSEKYFLTTTPPQVEYPSYVFSHCPGFPTIIDSICHTLLKCLVYCVLPYHVNSLKNWDCVHQVHQFCLQHQSGKVSGKG